MRLVDRQAHRPTAAEAALEVVRSRAFDQLRAYGFTPAQAQALAETGLGVVGVVDVTRLFFGADACNSRPVIRGDTQ